ncbi:uncharacterized protein LOC125240503 [Leguminivora glycinivorella]|uniref:uncharacterized protein LOC125240503 n=1 Tax=Leguminivora glycinivorella TaxID=1035111 RepID=UPI00200EE0B1|nr:uncharacterized protein LOC125240503 [Leguminivora glycinivorella]
MDVSQERPAKATCTELSGINLKLELEELEQLITPIGQAVVQCLRGCGNSAKIDDIVKRLRRSGRGQVFLPTALVQAQSKTGSGITLRCLIDQCSEASFITESAAQLLGLNKVYHKSTVTGLGGEESSPVNSKSVVKVKISSLLEPDFEVNVHAHVLGKVTPNRPRKFIDIDSWSDLSKLDLADYTFNIPGKIDLLLGGEVYGQILLNEMIKAPQGALIAQRTSLGWIVSGPTHLGESEIRTSVSVNHIHLDENELLKKFWELEADHNTTDPKRHYNEDEKKCEEFFNATTERDSTGRYIVKLPFRDQDPSCKRGNFVPIATRRLNQLEKRFAKDAEMKKRYSDVINEYLELEHMEEVPPEQENNPDAVYLPHHAVIRDDRSTSKLRVVFDASCPGSNGVSLNQDLLVGPTLQPVLRHTILRWRCHPICLVADIVKMYRQVKVHEDDVDFQRILWRENSGEKIKHLRLLRVTFGTASAPHLAVRALQQVAHDEGAQYPNAADRVLNHFYVDDLLTGCESVEEGKVVYQEMNELLQKGGFELQKWSSNSEELMRHMKESDVKEEAFKRFTARRGHCADLWSDNGTNFVGAARELKQLYAEEKSSIAVEIADQLASNSTNWHWIPPHSPNFGGLWEAGVKSTKHHLRRVIGNSTLTFEEMSTVLAQIEACLNSRP